MIRVTDAITLDDDEIEERFIRSPGPGGQHVNKTESAVQVRFDARNCPALNQAVFRRLKTLAGRRMTLDGVIVLTANTSRSQDRNRKDAVERLVELIRDAAVPPKIRRATKPSLGAKRRRMENKRQRSGVKKGRGKPGPDD
ncbi:MAG: aminoacyl-tRNA hydrolase [Alphaproteobacteria bacterium]|jgi:ribosome-associated protein|nr:aminoacyl-tRNA hydrolase [Alphaproteobacteria bacterium]MBT7942335.1 aminoacyl-tRNA hydrolase [Alphaproteobacteria bacterium]